MREEIELPDREIRLGLFLSGQHPPEASAAAAVCEHLEQVELARSLGFSSVWAAGCGAGFIRLFECQALIEVEISPRSRRQFPSTLFRKFRRSCIKVFAPPGRVLCP